MDRYVVAMAIALLVLTVNTVAQKQGYIALEFTPPPAGMKTGDVVETTLTFRARVDVDQLKVSVYPFNGVEVTSTPTEMAFGQIKKGAATTMKVKVRLTAAKFGSLAVSMETLTADDKSSDAKTIVYGDPNR